MTPEFRHAIFTWQYRPPPNTTLDFLEIPPDTDSDNKSYDPPPEHCIPFQLQCLFARLHKSVRGSCSTKPLTKSFHWDDGQAFQQNDVQVILFNVFSCFMRFCDINIIKYK